MTPWAGKTLKYTLLPGIVPRLSHLLGSGFSQTALCMALVLQGVRLLPPGHPYANGVNAGRFGIRHVLAAAAANLVFDRKHIDQIFIFFMIVTGLILLFMQAGLFVLTILAEHPAFAAAGDGLKDLFSSDYIYNPGTEQDLAFISLDRIFGIKNLYNSCVALGKPCLDMNDQPFGTISAFPSSMQFALHKILQFYSMGLFFIAAIIIIYYVIAVVAETAQSGTPFGQRFNKTWVPIRLIVFFALLSPLPTGSNYDGLSGAHLITLWTAKLGSNFATNGWGYFNHELRSRSFSNVSALLGSSAGNVSTPQVPAINKLVQFMYMAKLCQVAEKIMYPDDYKTNETQIEAYIVRPAQVFSLLSSKDALLLKDTDYARAFDFANKGDIIIRFGSRDPKKHTSDTGAVKPVCGEIVFRNPVRDKPGDPQSASNKIQQIYYNNLRKMWGEEADLGKYAQCMIEKKIPGQSKDPAVNDPVCAQAISAQKAKEILEKYKQKITSDISAVITEANENGNWGLPERVFKRGWAGAAIWYNQIAELNGAVATSVLNVPAVTHYPMVFETVALKNQAKDKNVTGDTMFDPAKLKDLSIEYERENDETLHHLYYDSYQMWNSSEGLTDTRIRSSGNPVIDFIASMFGANGLFSFRKNINVHPLAQLSSLGKSIMDAAILNITIGTIGEVGPAFIKEGVLGAVAKGVGLIAAVFSAIGWASLVLGLILYYILPFIPFIYFFFALSNWVKSIFEAIVGMPLWALAHIRIDGNGLPGNAAAGGYFLLFEIFLRPILILFGLIASVSVYSAVIDTMNQVFDLVTANLTGFDYQTESETGVRHLIQYARGSIDQLMFTIMYVMLCYILALGIFKSIDEIPKSLLRWMGASVKTFSEQIGDPAAEITSQVSNTLALMQGGLSGGQLASLLR